MNIEHKYLYHVTNLENLTRIMQQGIKCNEEGNIFLFLEGEFVHPHTKENLKVSDSIIKNQREINEPLVLRINADGITGVVSQDTTAEFTAPFQFILKQPVIKSKYIRPIVVNLKPRTRNCF